MSRTKRYLEWVSVHMGFGGEVTPAVIRASQREEALAHYRALQRVRQLSLVEPKSSDFDNNENRERRHDS